MKRIFILCCCALFGLLQGQAQISVTCNGVEVKEGDVLTFYAVEDDFGDYVAGPLIDPTFKNTTDQAFDITVKVKTSSNAVKGGLNWCGITMTCQDIKGGSEERTGTLKPNGSGLSMQLRGMFVKDDFKKYEAMVTVYKGSQYYISFKEIFIYDGNEREEPTFTIIDEGVAEYTKATASLKEEINYIRTFTHTGWQALYVPFDIHYNQISDDFEVAELNDFHQYDDNSDGIFDRAELEILRLREDDIIKHNTPYVIRPNEVGEKTITLANAILYDAKENTIDCSSTKVRYVFHGNYCCLYGNYIVDNYILIDGILCKASPETAFLGGCRWYVSLEDRTTGETAIPANMPAKICLVEKGNDITTSIQENKRNPTAFDSHIYDLNGCCVGHASQLHRLPKGVYIMNGLKIMR